jgi:hypothetical protein
MVAGPIENNSFYAMLGENGCSSFGMVVGP